MKTLHEHKKMISQYPIIFIIIIGLLLRLWGIDFGLPYLYNPDEPVFVSRAGRILQNRDFNPHWFGAPATTTIYMLSGLYTVIFVIGRALGVFVGPSDLATLYFADPTIFFLSGRLMIAAFGATTILLVYFIGRRLFNRVTGLVAAALIALSPIHVYYSKLVRMDIQMTFLILVAFWFCLNIVEKGDCSDYALAGLFTGLAIVTKYPAAVMILTILLAHFVKKRWQIEELARLAGSGVACLAGAFVGSPFLFLDFRTALSDIRFEARSTHLSATGQGLIRDVAWYLRGPIPNAISTTGLLLAGVGFVICLIAIREKDKYLLITFPVFFLLFIASLNLRWERWIIPAIPFSCILSAYGLSVIPKCFGRRLDSRIASWLVASLLLAVVSAPLIEANVVQGQEISSVDTRTLARRWMIDNIPPESRVLMETYTPQLPKRFFTYFIEKDEMLVEWNPEITRHKTFYPGGHVGRIKDVQDVWAEDVQYVVLSNIYDRYLANEETYPSIVTNYEELMRHGTMIYKVESTVGTNRVGKYWHNPNIRIYRLN